VLISFDIDGTMEFGHPPGPVTVEFVRALAVNGHVIGSASDRTRTDQSSLWQEYGIKVAFVGGKHHLHEVRERFPAERHVHIGDTHVDEHYARLAGFEFCSLDDWETIAQA
jgi:hydroxymethylpyrimidine pyrophosphatase-like HAD family hydrolase